MLTKLVSDVSEAVQKLLNVDILTSVSPHLCHRANDFRGECCYTEDVSNVLIQYEPSLRRLFLAVGGSDAAEVASKHLASLWSLSEWLAFLRKCRLLGSDLTERDAKLAFAWARMAVIDGQSDKGAVKESNLPFEGFLEAICRLSILKSLPTEDEIKEAGHVDCGAYMLDLKISDETAYDKLVDSRAAPWPGSATQPPSQLVEHMVSFMFHLVVEATNNVRGGLQLWQLAGSKKTKLTKLTEKQVAAFMLEFEKTG